MAWAFPYRGEVVVSGEPVARELLVFEASNQNVTFTATTDAWGVAAKHQRMVVFACTPLPLRYARASPTFMKLGGSSMLPVGCNTHWFYATVARGQQFYATVARGQQMLVATVGRTRTCVAV